MTVKRSPPEGNLPAPKRSASEYSIRSLSRERTKKDGKKKGGKNERKTLDIRFFIERHAYSVSVLGFARQIRSLFDADRVVNRPVSSLTLAALSLCQPEPRRLGVANAVASHAYQLIREEFETRATSPTSPRCWTNIRGVSKKFGEWSDISTATWAKSARACTWLSRDTSRNDGLWIYRERCERH